MTPIAGGGAGESAPDWFYDDDTDCANCGGEGFVSHCFQEFACMYPDEGCDDCMRRCDWCNRPAPQPKGAEHG